MPCSGKRRATVLLALQLLSLSFLIPLRLSRIAAMVAFSKLACAEPFEMFVQRFPDKSRPTDFSAPRGQVGDFEQPRVKYDLNCLHDPF